MQIHISNKIKTIKSSISDTVCNLGYKDFATIQDKILYPIYNLENRIIIAIRNFISQI